MAIVKFALGWNRVNPPHELIATEGGFIECSELQNFIAYDKYITKVGGTVAYNATSLGTDNGIPWVERSYHIRGDLSVVSRTFAFYDGDIYYGDDVAGTLTVTNATGFRKKVIPLSATFQVAGNSILYFYTGEDTPMKYDGNGSFNWETTTLESDIVGGVSHLQRMWNWKKNSSSLIFSENLKPESSEDEILVGDNARDSFVIACAKTGNERFFVFKNNSIWELQGRTKTTFRFIRITEKFGLANKRALYVVGGGIIFLDENTKELHFFGGTEASIQPLTENHIQLRDIMDQTPDSINNATFIVHKGLLRFAFQHTAAPIDGNDSELIYSLNDLRPGGLPRWSLIRGTNVNSYTRFTKYGDNNDLVTGRSVVGKIMYHDRGKNFDDFPIHTKVRTGEIVASETKKVRFKGFWVKGKPTSHTLPITFRYYMDARNPQHGGTADLIPKGETRTVGTIVIQQQKLFNDRLVPLTKLSRGNSIAFEFEDNNIGTDVEIYSVAFEAQDRGKLRNQLVLERNEKDTNYDVNASLLHDSTRRVNNLHRIVGRYGIIVLSLKYLVWYDI